jgi:hypothetical protein
MSRLAIQEGIREEQDNYSLNQDCTTAAAASCSQGEANTATLAVAVSPLN